MARRFWPGLVTTALSAMAAAYFWVDPRESLLITGSGNWLGVFAFMLIGVMIGALNELWRRGTLSDSARTGHWTSGSKDDRGRIS